MQQIDCQPPEKRPAFWSYYRMVWRKATETEGGAWVKRTGLWLWTTLLGISGMGIVYGFWSVLEAQRMSIGVVSIGTLSLALYKMLECLLRAPHQMHCEQIDKQESLRQQAAAELRFAIAEQDAIRGQMAAIAVERDEAVKIVQEKPLGVVAIKRHLKVLEKWLRDQATNQPDLSEQRDKYLEVVNSLMPQHTWKWESVSFRPNEPGKSDYFLQVKADLVAKRMNDIVTSNDYCGTWRPLNGWLSIQGMSISHVMRPLR